MNNFFAQSVTYLLLPFFLIQGLWVRLKTPRLPEASGPCTGVMDGEGVPLQLIVLGESPVAGIGAGTHEFGLAGRTASCLSRLTTRTVNWRAMGLSGATAQRALKEIAPQITNDSADVVVIALGVNDVLEWRGARRWAHDLEQLISDVRRRLGNPLIILTGVPPFQYFPAFPQPLKSVLGMRARLLDQAAMSLAERLSEVIHVTTQFRLEREMFCPDGFHPSQLGYAMWGEHLAEVIVKSGKVSVHSSHYVFEQSS